MRTATRTAHHANALSINIFAMRQHPVEKDIATSSLIDVGTTGVMRCLTYLLLTFAPTIDVEVDTDGTHTSQGA